MRRSRLRIALLASAVVVLSSLVLVAPVPGQPAVAVADTAAATGAAGLFVPLTGRLLDTRNGTGGYATPMPANTVRTVAAAGVVGIPSSGVSALALTLTAVGAPTAGAVSVAPADVATPTGTALVFNPSDSVSNTDLVALHADGQLHVLSNAAVNLIIDVQGYFTAGSATAPGGFVPLDQARIVDTRNGTNVPQAQVTTGNSITVTAAGLAGVPSEASAVYVNIAVLGQTTNGYLRTYAADAAVPTTGALGFDASTQAESVAIPLSGDGAFTVLVGAGGPVDLLVDIQGYFTPTAGSGVFTPAAVRLLDTRAAPVRTIAGNGVLTLSVAGLAGIPAVADGLAAVALNLRTVQTSTSPASGYLRVWPSDQPEPAISSVNYTRLDTYRADLVIVAPAADGTVKIHNGGPSAIDLVVDVEGWFLTSPPPAPITFSYQYPEGTTVPPSTAAVFAISTPTEPTFPVSGFAWSLDGGPTTTVPAQLDQDVVLAHLTLPSDLGSSDGPHTLQLVTVDQQGRRSPATTYSWTTQAGAPAPDTVPADPIVTSPTYPENRWTPATSTAEFVINDSGQQPPVTALSYALDDADPITVNGDSADLALPSPSSDGLHVLHVSATSTVGESGYDYAFYLGTTPTAVGAVAATAGQGSVLLSWPAASGPVNGYDVQLVDTSGQAADIGTCADCTSMAVNGLPVGQVLTARVSATATAGPSPATSSGVFTVGSSGTSAACSASTCQSVDASCTLTTCDTSTTSGDAVYAMHYIDMDGSSAVVAQGDSAAHLVSRANDGTGGNAGIMAASGALSISVTTGVPAQLDGSGSSTTPAQPDATTPRGYHLLGNNVIDPFHYRSDRASVVVDKTINRRKYLIGETTTQMRETLYGGSSHRWLIGIQAAYVAGDPYDFYYLYTCGINVPKTEDWTCNTHEADADGVYDEHVVYGAVWNTYEQHNASFGSSETRYAKFPMVDWRVTYHDAGATLNDDVRYRGWDIRFQNHTWVMSAVSGTGF